MARSWDILLRYAFAIINSVSSTISPVDINCLTFLGERSPIFSVTDQYSLCSRKNFTNHGNEDTILRIRLRIYTGSSIDTATIAEFSLQGTELIFNSIDHSKPSVLYIHGFREDPNSESIRTVVGAYLKRGNDNIMVLDWSDLAFENYITVAAMTRDIASAAAKTFDDLVDLGLNLETFHCVGHSLGAQISGFLGKISKNSIPRITGLDPAKPGFYHPGARHIDAKSARFVDIVHTDGGLYGALRPTGTVDFFPNGGRRPQPGCSIIGFPMTPRDFCSHWKSWRYYAESVVDTMAFPAVQCPSYDEYRSGNCSGNRIVYYGYATPTDARGSFYFDTNKKSPFSKNTHRQNLLRTG